MINEEIRNYHDLTEDEKQMVDDFREMKLAWNHARFSLYKFRIEDIISHYEKMIQLRKDIQQKYYAIIEELNNVELIEGHIDDFKWSTHRENEDLVWNAEMQLLDEIKANFDIAINMIESGEAEREIIQAEIW